jgi:hypothetical protein
MCGNAVLVTDEYCHIYIIFLSTAHYYVVLTVIAPPNPILDKLSWKKYFKYVN